MNFEKKYFAYFLFLFFILIQCNESGNALTQKAVQGVLDLKNIKNKNEYIIKLDGEWKITWDTFTNPKDFQNNKKKLKSNQWYVFPYSWNGLELENKKKGGDGSATLQLQILLPSTEKQIGIHIRELSSAYSLYINGELVISRGVPSINASSSKPEVKPASYYFKPNSNVVHITIHISNFSHRKGGVWHSIYFGELKSIHQFIDYQRFQDTILLGIFFIIAVYHFGLYIIRTKDLSNLIFSLFCIDIFLRHGFTGERLLLEFFPWISFANMLRVDYATMFFGVPIALNFFYLIFPGIIYKHLLHFFYFMGGFFTLFCLLNPPEIFTHSIPYFQPVLYFGIVTSLYIILKSMFEKRPHIWLLSLGLIALCISIVNDLLFAQETLRTGFTSQYGFCILILTQAFVISERFAFAYKKSEELSYNLESLNSAYARFVPTAFLKLLNKKDIREVHLGDQLEKNMTVLYSDVLHFKELSDTMTSKENFSFLNSYLGKMTPIISQHNGFINKYFADTIVALFPKRSEDALNAAIAMQHEIQILNLERLKDKQHEIQIKMGLHSGNLMLGTIGSTERMDATVISNVIDTTFKIKNLATKYTASIFISEDLLLRFLEPKLYEYRFANILSHRKNFESLRVFEVMNGQPEYKIDLYIETKESFENAVESYLKGDFQTSMKLMKQVLKINPEDTVAKVYHENSINSLVS